MPKSMIAITEKTDDIKINLCRTCKQYVHDSFNTKKIPENKFCQALCSREKLILYIQYLLNKYGLIKCKMLSKTKKKEKNDSDSRANLQ